MRLKMTMRAGLAHHHANARHFNEYEDDESQPVKHQVSKSSHMPPLIKSSRRLKYFTKSGENDAYRNCARALHDKAIFRIAYARHNMSK